MKRIIWTWGLIAGIIVSTVMAFSTISGSKNPELMMGTRSMIIGYLSMLVAFSLIYLAIKTFRDKQNNGVISFGKAFTIGILVALVASTMYVAVWAIVYHFAIPNFMEVYTNHMLKVAETTANATELKIKAEQMQKFKEMYKNPLFFTLLTYSEILPVGILVSIISAFILKRKKSRTDLELEGV